MIDTLEIRPMAHPTNKHGVYHVARNQFIASFPTCLEAYRFGFGYLNETISQMRGDVSEARETVERRQRNTADAYAHKPVPRLDFVNNRGE
jgi:hypothetical protein